MYMYTCITSIIVTEQPLRSEIQAQSVTPSYLKNETRPSILANLWLPFLENGLREHHMEVYTYYGQCTHTHTCTYTHACTCTYTCTCTCMNISQVEFWPTICSSDFLLCGKPKSFDVIRLHPQATPSQFLP